MSKQSLTFNKLAESILTRADKPLTANEIWDEAVAQNLHKKLSSQGKTPWATLAAKLYVSVRDEPGGSIQVIGQRPKRFYLKEKVKELDLEGFKNTDEAITTNNNHVKSYLEKDLHPLLSYFAYYHLSCYTKTISHSKSDKKEFGEWVHPDIVGCVFPIEKWNNEVSQLSSAVGNTSIKFISFELKKELNLSTLREKFFQTVSNSSWANESYLVASEISKNEDFLSELARLSASFGIGVIHLNVHDPNSSETLFPAKTKDNLDWETVNKLTMNRDFKEFLKRIRIDLTSNEIRKEKYDKVYTDEDLVKLIKTRY
jgi:hypothetical protein